MDSNNVNEIIEREFEAWGPDDFDSIDSKFIDYIISKDQRKQLTKVKIPDYIFKIGKDTFKDCINLVDVELPKELEIVGKSCFENCYKLSTIIFPKTLKKIDDLAFASTGLTKIFFSGPLPNLGFLCFDIADTNKKLIIYLPDPRDFFCFTKKPENKAMTRGSLFYHDRKISMKHPKLVQFIHNIIFENVFIQVLNTNEK